MSRFKEVLHLPDGIWSDRSFSDEEIKTIQLALRIADRLESGDVSDGMLMIGQENYKETALGAPIVGRSFKAMSAQLIKEESGE